MVWRRRSWLVALSGLLWCVHRAVLPLRLGCAPGESRSRSSQGESRAGSHLSTMTRAAIPGGQPTSRRVAPDGTYAIYANTRSALVDGKIVIECLEPDWRILARLTADQLARITAALRAGSFELDSEYHPCGASAVGFRMSWSACLEGRRNTVVRVFADPASTPSLAADRDAFELAVGEVIAAAGERERKVGDDDTSGVGVGAAKRERVYALRRAASRSIGRSAARSTQSTSQ